jgi:threonyl-tRNA synthetase
MNIQITFPDGAQRSYLAGTTGMEIARSISEGLARNVLAMQLDGQTCDISTQVTTDATVRFFTWNDAEGKAVFWHSSAHLMAEALEAFYPGVKFGIGPPIERGFYYDVDFGDTRFSSDDFEKVEKKMLELAKRGQVEVRQGDTFSPIPIRRKDP